MIYGCSQPKELWLIMYMYMYIIMHNVSSILTVVLESCSERVSSRDEGGEREARDVSLPDSHDWN